MWQKQGDHFSLTDPRTCIPGIVENDSNNVRVEDMGTGSSEAIQKKEEEGRSVVYVVFDLVKGCI